MLNKFWEKNTGILNVTGLLGALAALFLTVSLPDNDEAQSALLSMQAILLLSLSISFVFLSRSMWITIREIKTGISPLFLEYSWFDYASEMLSNKRELEYN